MHKFMKENVQVLAVGPYKNQKLDEKCTSDLADNIIGSTRSEKPIYKAPLLVGKQYI